MIRVEVTAEDIKRGVRASEFKCPVAYGLQRATRKRWCVKRSSAYHLGPEESMIYLLPDAAQRFILAFDAGGRVKPFDFDLPEPD